jgi:hypothetical protein
MISIQKPEKLYKLAKNLKQKAILTELSVEPTQKRD